MKNKGAFITQTTQTRSLALISKSEKGLTKDKLEVDDNMVLLTSVFDSLNKLYETLSRLDNVIQRKSMEQINNCQSKGEKNGKRTNAETPDFD
jgi:hypothetical protein